MSANQGGMVTAQRDEVLTIDELAGYLRMPKSTLYKLAREGSIPCQKVGKHWRFHKSAIDGWLSHTSRMGSTDPEDEKHPPGQGH